MHVFVVLIQSADIFNKAFLEMEIGLQLRSLFYPIKLNNCYKSLKHKKSSLPTIICLPLQMI